MVLGAGFFSVSSRGKVCGSSYLPFFPPAVGRSSSVQVSVRSLPRTSEVPRVVCGFHQQQSPVGSGASGGSSEDEEGKLGMAGSLAWREINK